MKGKISLMWRVAVALVLVLSFSLMAAVPAMASQVGTVTVTVSPNTQHAIGEHTISFTTTSALAATEAIWVDFTEYVPTETHGGDVPDSYATGDVTVNGALVIGGNVNLVTTMGGDSKGTHNTHTIVKIITPVDIGAGDSVEVVFKSSAGIKNPDANGAQTLDVRTTTDSEDKTSTPYIIAGSVGKPVTLSTSAGEFVNSYDTIAGAIADAGITGWTIEVSSDYDAAIGPESFPIDVTVDKLTIKSIDGAASTTIDASASGKDAIQVSADNVTIGGSGVGFTIKGATGMDGVYFNGPASPTVQGNIITGKLARGIEASGSTTGITIKENTLTCTGPAITNGMTLYLGASSLIDSNEVSGFNCGISLLPGSGPPPSGWADAVTVSNNTCYGNLNEGIGVDPGLDYLVISGNDCYDNIGSGIGLCLSDAEIDKVKVVNNNLYDNEHAGLRLYSGDADVVYVFGNNIYGNTSTVGTTTGDDYGILNSGSGTVSADHNWWGDASGPCDPNENPSGTGDKTSTKVTVTPWLEASVSAAAFAQGDTATSLDAATAVGVKVSNVVSDADNKIGAALYTANPKATPTFTVVEDSYTDVYVAPGAPITATDEIILKFSPAGIDENSVVYAWGGLAGVWEECTIQNYSSYGGYIWVKVHSELNTTAPTTPTIEALAGLPFVVGTGAAALESIAASPESVTLDVDETQQLTVTATYSDDTTADVTADASYESSATSVATVSTGGLITGVAEGSATITVSYTEGGITKTDTVSVTVSVFDVYELYDADEDGVISKSEATTAVVDYFDEVITKDQALEVIVEYMG